MDVGVLTNADPNPGLLRVTRTIIQRTPELRAIFMNARSEAWGAERLTNELNAGLTPYFDGPVPEEPENVRAVAAYLADEYLQVGDAVLLVSSDTGRAIAKLTDDDFYQPPMVAREDGTMVTPGRRVRPEIEAFVVQWQFDRAYEQKTEAALVSKLPQTALLRAEGDNRLLFATKQGRKVLLAQVSSELPTLLPDFTKGSTRELFRYFEIVKSPPVSDRYVSLGEFTSEALVTHPLQDKKAKNLRHDVRHALLATIASGWARRLAAFVASSTGDLYRLPTTMTALREGVQPNLDSMWVCSSNAYVAFGAAPTTLFPVDLPDDLAFELLGPCVQVVIDESSYDIKDRELFDRWEVAATFRATVWVNWRMTVIYNITDAPKTGLSVEVL